MRAFTKILAAGVAAAALFSAAPAVAQYYPGYSGYGYGGGDVVSQVIGQVLGGGYGGYGGYGYNQYGYGANSQAVVGQCVNAVQARLNGGYGGYGSYGYNPYGYSNYGRARVLGISRVEPRSSGGLTVRGVANSGVTGYANNNVDLTFKCKTDYRGFISSVSIDRAQPSYGYNNQYTPYNPYEAYGYRRY